MDKYYEKLLNYSMLRKRILAISKVMEQRKDVTQDFFLGISTDVFSIKQYAREKGLVVKFHGNGFATFTRIQP